MTIAVSHRVWLIGGTSESAELARQLLQHQIPCTVSVTTAAARALYPPSALLQVVVGRLGPGDLERFLQQQAIAAILDASHPFAVEISRLAMVTATQYGLPYLRYERPGQALPAHVLTVPDYPTLLATDWLENQRVLLTIGYRNLELFQPWQTRATLFARILPSPEALEAALQAGFTPDRLVALRPPLGRELERALWQHWQISVVVTKASGAAGRETLKAQLAGDLGIQLIVITRPQVAYLQVTSDVATALKFCYEATSSACSDKNH